MAPKNGPVKTLSIGRIRVKIWANRSQENGAWFNTEIVRVYKEGDKYSESAQFGRNDLPLVQKAADWAFAWIVEQEVPAHESEAIE